MKRIAIQDANILIDLINCDLLGHVLVLDFKFFTTSIIKAELIAHQDSVLNSYVEKGKIEVISISSEDFTLILELTSKFSKLSAQDCSALYYVYDIYMYCYDYYVANEYTIQFIISYSYACHYAYYTINA